MKYFTMTQYQDNDYYKAELDVWADVDQLENARFAKPTAHITALAYIMRYDGESCAWVWTNYKGEKKKKPLACVNVQDRNDTMPGAWYGVRYENVTLSEVDNLAKLNRAIARTIGKYNLKYKYEYDELARIIAALQELGYKYFYRRDDKLIEISKLIY